MFRLLYKFFANEILKNPEVILDKGPSYRYLCDITIFSFYLFNNKIQTQKKPNIIVK